MLAVARLARGWLLAVVGRGITLPVVGRLGVALAVLRGLAVARRLFVRRFLGRGLAVCLLAVTLLPGRRLLSVRRLLLPVRRLLPITLLPITLLVVTLLPVRGLLPVGLFGCCLLYTSDAAEKA